MRITTFNSVKAYMLGIAAFALSGLVAIGVPFVLKGFNGAFLLGAIVFM